MDNWWSRFPGRLEAEVEAFRTTEGLDLKLDEVELRAAGRVIFRGELTRPGHEPVKLEVRYPDSFPYMRPEVFTPGLMLGRHQNPYRRNLCLLDRSTRNWVPEDTGAWLVSEQVPLLLDLLADPDRMRREEAPQGEPASAFLITQPGAVVFVPEEMLGLDETHKAGIAWFSAGARDPRTDVVRVCMTRLAERGVNGKTEMLATASGAVAKRFDRQAYEGRWVRLPELPTAGGSPVELLAAAQAAPGFERPPLSGPTGAAKIRILGVVTKEEVRQGEWEDTWAFVVESGPKRARQRAKSSAYIARGERLSARDLGVRIPTLEGLQNKVVALVGLGAIGAPIMLELLRAQVGELRILDGDSVETGTIVRWPFGLHAVAQPKASLLAEHARQDYPFTVVKSYDRPIGWVAAPEEPTALRELDVINALLDGADILIDATAETGLQQFLAAAADEAGIPQVYAWATEGGWGGAVARVVPGHTGCWWCLQKHIDEKSIKPAPAATTGHVQPRGCSAPTWTGTSFAALPIVAQTVRTACFTLLAGRAPAEPMDVFICDQQAGGLSELAAPSWTAYPLRPHADCRACADAEAA